MEGGQGGCERSFCENPLIFIYFYFFLGGGGLIGGGGGGVGLRGQGGCERRIEVFEKIHKKNPGGWGGRGVRVGGSG